MKTQSKNRLILIAVLLLFAAPLVIAFVLNQQGWHPQNTRNSGTLVEPPYSVVSAPVTLAGGRMIDPEDVLGPPEERTRPSCTAVPLLLV